MNKNSNMSPFDRVLRTVVGVSLIYIAIFTPDFISDHLFGGLLGIFGIINVVSAVIGICPVYLAAGVSTFKKVSEQSHQH